MGLQRAERSSAGFFKCLWLRSRIFIQMFTMSASNWTKTEKLLSLVHGCVVTTHVLSGLVSTHCFGSAQLVVHKNAAKMETFQHDKVVCVYLPKVPFHCSDVVSTSLIYYSLFIHHIFLLLRLFRQKHPVICRERGSTQRHFKTALMFELLRQTSGC